MGESDPAFVAMRDQMRSAMRDVATTAKDLQPNLRAAGLTRRQARRVVEKWVTHLLTSGGREGEA